ncbi:hypothetical protein FNV43_RR12223 [Rhamnella rubrinervis]|uniref:Histone-lysine N-methyltransferase ASHH2 n=1 Tax=Rhamnella rubrinervis TaxID=2594499 RepID=A0A8K0H7Y9_9ROSA|nr:hypothetical protein FNV43_RR12223 [Rhamnella rubrinervis]
MDEPFCPSITEQHLCSEFSMQSVPEQQSCSEPTYPLLDPTVDTTAGDGRCLDMSSDDNTGCKSSGGVTVNRDGMVAENDNVDVLALESVLENRCGDSGDCLNENQSDIDVCSKDSGGECLKDRWLQSEDSLADLSEPPSEVVPVSGSPRSCVQQDVEEITSVSCFCEEGVIQVTENKGDVLPEVNTDLGEQASPLQVCEVSLESVPIDGVIGNTVEQNEHDFKSIGCPVEDSNGKIVFSADGKEADICSEIASLKNGEMLSEVHAGEEVSHGDWKNYQKDDSGIGCLSVERITEVVGMKSNLDSCTQISSSPDCQKTLEDVHTSTCLSISVQQNEQLNDNSIDSSSTGSVTVFMEDKSDFTTNVEIEIGTQILPLEEKGFKITEGSSRVAPDSIVEKSVSPKSCQALITVNNGSSRLDVQDQLENDVSGPDNCSSAVGCSEQRDNDGKNNVKVDCVSDSKCCDIVLPSSQRNSRRGKSNRKSKSKKAARKCRNTANVLTSRGSIKLILEIARKKRSCLSKPARTSIWGLLGNVTRHFENCNGLEVIQVQNQGSRKQKGGQKNGKRNNSGGASGSSQGSSAKCGVSTNGLRFKVKVGKIVGQSCLNIVTVPEVGDTLPSSTAISSDCGTEFCPRNGSGSPKLVRCIEDELGTGETARQLMFFCNNQEKLKLCTDASVLDAQLANKDLESNVITEKSPEDLRGNFRAGEEASGGPSESRCKDPGTSPDSEVINLNPGVHLDSRPHEGLHGTLLTSPNDFVATVDLTSSKRGKKKKKVSGAGNCIMKDGLPCSLRINKAKPSKRHGQRQNSSEGFCSSETLTSSASANASSNSSSDKEPSKEPLNTAGNTKVGISLDAIKMESSTEAKTHCNEDICFGLSKSQNSKNTLPAAKPKGRAVPKSRSKGSDSGGKRVNRRQKETQQRSVNKKKTKEKAANDQVVCKVESHLEEDDIGKTNSGSNIASLNVPHLDMLPGGPDEQYLPLHNAWVRCDDCLKWRRIPAVLADSIEETKCTWSCKNNMDKAFACCSIPQEKSNAEINAELEISDASGEEDASGNRLNHKALECRRPQVSQENVTRIRTNQFLHRNRKTLTIDEIMVCHCKPPSDGTLGCGDDCLNRLLNIECVQGACPCRDRCSNQQFQKRQYAKVAKVSCGKKGYGLKLLQDMSKGQFLIEYVGEVLDMHAYEARQKEYAMKGHKHFYFMTLNGSEVIDACVKGNLGRFINHSCDPNCRTEKWMVNGEICIGLFALRDIKKGEEVTFDYNYVRVFGAAAKKCYCGSDQCRGYIGGDPLNSEVIVQDDSDDETPDPILLPEDGETEDSVDNLMPKAISSNGVVKQSAEYRDERDESITATEKLVLAQRKEDSSMNQSTSDISHINDALGAKGKLPSSAQPFETSQQTDDVTSKLMSVVQQEISIEEENIEKSSSSSPRLETSSIKMDGKSLSDGGDAWKSRSDTVEDKRVSSKAYHNKKTSPSSSFVKKGKVKGVPHHATKVQVAVNKSQVLSIKPKKLIEGSSHIETVEGKLNELLDADGGISKRKDAPKGYLKLLLLTAASGDSANGEAIQSNRDLSMILDALLKTKSRVVLMDILNKNGLRMLHNIMKQYRRDFKKIPILRKLLKVLEYLAVREILTPEHINGGPPCPGMESFRESMLSLTEHDDRQVHQIARNFRDRWIPRPIRRPNFADREDGKTDFHRNSNGYRFSALHNNLRDQGGRPTEAIDCVKQSTVGTTAGDAGVPEGCSAPCVSVLLSGGTKTRKRKSRWDQPAEPKEQKIDPGSTKQFESSSLPGISQVAADMHDHCQLNGANMAHDGSEIALEDAPPGFSSSHKTTSVSSVSSSMADHSKRPPHTVIGLPQEKFVSRLPVSYGIPLSIMQQFGSTYAETVGCRVVAPGMPFSPFPPLPPFPRDKKDRSPSQTVNHMTVNEPATQAAQLEECLPATSHSNENSPSTTGDRPDLDVPFTDNQHSAKRGRGSSWDLGRRFKQQKWNNIKSGPPPWILNRSGGMGNPIGAASSIGVGKVTNELRNTHCSEDLSCKAEKDGNNFYQHQEQHNQH